MGKIFFNGSSGSNYTKKRKRVKGADHHVRNEVKQYNPFVAIDNSRNNYGSFYISNIYFPDKTGQGQSDVKYGSWQVIPLSWPNAGQYQSERIGNQFYLKYLRFLGYIGVTASVYRDCSWRLVLYRSSNGPLYEDTDLTINARIDKLLSHVYKNYENFSNVSTSVTSTQVARHNYYKKMVNVDNKEIYSRKVIASGIIPKNWDASAVSSRSVGASSGFQQGFTSDYLLGDGRRYLPIDIKVTCNDWIKINEVYYYIVLETDSVMGINITQLTTSVFPSATESNLFSRSLFSFNLFCRAYFIDP